jgi:hypothetical protein
MWLASVAFRRSFCGKLVSRPGTDVPEFTETHDKDVWLTSPYAQIEPAMTYQLGLPILIGREEGVVADGVLERGVTGLHAVSFNLAGRTIPKLGDPEWSQRIEQWAGRVRSVYEKQGEPPRLY